MRVINPKRATGPASGISTRNPSSATTPPTRSRVAGPHPVCGNNDCLGEDHADTCGQEGRAGEHSGCLRVQVESVLDNEARDDLDEPQGGEHAKPGEQERPRPRVCRPDAHWLLDQGGTCLGAQPKGDQHEAEGEEYRDGEDRGHQPEHGE